MNIFEDKVAIVTGAGSGIGRALAEELARRGSRVIAADAQPARISETAARIEKSGGRVLPVVADVADFEEMKALVENAAAEHGRIDLLFNNAGIAVGGEARHFTPEDWQAVLAVNLFGVIHGVQAAYPLMVKQGFGHIINTASIEGLVPFPAAISYVVSKHAVAGLSGALRLEGADLGVKVSVVCPGFIKTAIFEDARLVKVARQKMLDQLPRLRGLTADQCARRILRGVERNRGIIIVGADAWFLWMLFRLSPALTGWLGRKLLRKAREEKVLLD